MANDTDRQLTIRRAREQDLEVMMELYRKARQFMADHGNPDQWPSSYPSRDMVEQDIRSGYMYACVSGERIAAVFYYRAGEEPDYRIITGGRWLNQEPYGVVHRITSDGSVKGAGSFCLEWAWRRCGNLKIDTHKDNRVMQGLLKKNGFSYCGIIHLKNGEERLAYQKGPGAQKL